MPITPLVAEALRQTVPGSFTCDAASGTPPNGHRVEFEGEGGTLDDGSVDGMAIAHTGTFYRVEEYTEGLFRGWANGSLSAPNGLASSAQWNATVVGLVGERDASGFPPAPLSWQGSIVYNSASGDLEGLLPTEPLLLCVEFVAPQTFVARAFEIPNICALPEAKMSAKLHTRWDRFVEQFARDAAAP